LIRNGLTPKNINDGIKQLILDARKHGLKVACASLSSNARLELECLGLIKLFDYITDYKNHEHDSYFTDAKKTVSTTMLILQNLKLNGHEIIGFEDDAAGIDDYNRHSVYSVAITHFNPKVGIDAKFQVNLPQQLNLEEIIFNYYQKDDTDN
jgi:beta-phosphoglucomutase